MKTCAKIISSILCVARLCIPQEFYGRPTAVPASQDASNTSELVGEQLKKVLEIKLLAAE